MNDTDTDSDDTDVDTYRSSLPVSATPVIVAALILAGIVFLTGLALLAKARRSNSTTSPPAEALK